jgi:hypothetical protein
VVIISSSSFADNCAEVVSKSQIRFKGKAQADRESAAYIGYVSIYRRLATQPLGLRWGFETTSNNVRKPV